jgi:2,3-bisphosphoglycerate-independent phosphoglycerate mutase
MFILTSYRFYFFIYFEFSCPPHITWPALPRREQARFWNLEFEIWFSESGIRDLEFGFRFLSFDIYTPLVYYSLMSNSAGKRPKPLVLVILDGLGVAPPNSGNAVKLAKTPNLDQFWAAYSHCYLHASGINVGLPSGVNGNSEVGHMSLGAGKVVFQEIARIDHEIEDGTFYNNETFKKAVQHAKQNKGRLHLLGLVSTGKVHSSMDHLFACLEFTKRNGLSQNEVFIHAFTDGRDTPPKSAKGFLKELEKRARSKDQIASVIGRFYAMDRDERWERTQKAYDLIVSGQGTKVKTWMEALDASYAKDITDEYIEPHVIIKGDDPVGQVRDGDTVIIFNYRADRSVQLSKAFEDENFNHWQKKPLRNLFFAGFSNYEKGFAMNRAKEDVEIYGGEAEMVKEYFKEELQKSEEGFPKNQIFPPEQIENPLGKVISDAGMKQIRITESEKYPHLTYFLNCRKKMPFENEERIEVPSPKDVKTYDLKPEMSALEVTNSALEKVATNEYDFIVINYACPDMVAHTGNLEASEKACEAADMYIKILSDAVLPAGGEMIITADHGNAEELINLQTGETDTEHSTNPVPFIFVSESEPVRELNFGLLADVAPTVITRLGLQIPSNMTGRDLLQ